MSIRENESQNSIQENSENPGNLKKKPKSRSATKRVRLDDESIKKVRDWKRMATASEHGLKLSSSDIVNWMLKKIPDEPSSKDVVKVRKEFFDPVKALEIATAKLKAAKLKGDIVDLNHLLRELTPFENRRKPSKIKDSPKPQSSSIKPIDR